MEITFIILRDSWVNGYEGADDVSFFEFTLPETNIAPENQWLEDEGSCWDDLFSRAMLDFHIYLRIILATWDSYETPVVSFW